MRTAVKKQWHGIYNMQNEISGYVYKGDDVHSDHHYGGLPGCPAGPAATRPIGLTDVCMNNNSSSSSSNNNNNNNSDISSLIPVTINANQLLRVRLSTCTFASSNSLYSAESEKKLGISYEA